MSALHSLKEHRRDFIYRLEARSSKNQMLTSIIVCLVYLTTTRRILEQLGNKLIKGIVKLVLTDDRGRVDEYSSRLSQTVETNISLIVETNSYTYNSSGAFFETYIHSGTVDIG